MEWRYFGQNHAHRLQYFIAAHLGLGLVLNDCDHSVSRDCGVDLNSNSFLRIKLCVILQDILGGFGIVFGVFEF